MMRRFQQADDPLQPVRRHVVNGLSLIEDVVYVGLAALLAVGALALLVSAFRSSVAALFSHSLSSQVIGLLDQILLVLLIIELLYTVQVSFREHALIAEPFLVVALIAVIRRVLVLTAEVPKLPQAGDEVFRRALWELGLLTAMIAVLVGSLVVLQRQARRKAQEAGSERREAA